MTYHPGRPMPDLPPCAPTQASEQCFSCVRHNPSIPADPMLRKRTVLLDASVVTRGGVCPMREVIQ